MSVSPIPEPKSMASQAYDYLSWAAGLATRAISATTSTAKMILSCGVDENPPIVKEWAAERHLQQRAFDKEWAKLPSEVRIRARMREALEKDACLERPETITALYASDYGLIAQLTEEQKKMYRETLATSSLEAALNALYGMDEHGNIYNSEGKLVPSHKNFHEFDPSFSAQLRARA